MAIIDLHYPVSGDELPTDHAYGLYGAISRIMPTLHTDNIPFRMAAITGAYQGNRSLGLDPRRSRLRVRVPLEVVPLFLPLTGQVLDVGGHPIRLGMPRVQALVPAPAVVARTVTIKGFTEAGPFLAAARRQLDALGVPGELGIPLINKGKHEGQPRRHVVRIKGRKVVGFTLQVEGLSAEESIRLQEAGIGGRGRLGCGFFIPLRASLQ
jgi:CRISPR-associated protein Cas6